MSAVPDPSSLTRDELESLVKELVAREQLISDERRTLHVQIDALRRELVERLRDEGETVIPGTDGLDPGSAGVREPRHPRPGSGSDGAALPEPAASEIEPEAWQ